MRTLFGISQTSTSLSTPPEARYFPSRLQVRHAMLPWNKKQIILLSMLTWEVQSVITGKCFGWIPYASIACELWIYNQIWSKYTNYSIPNRKDWQIMGQYWVGEIMARRLNIAIRTSRNESSWTFQWQKYFETLQFYSSAYLMSRVYSHTISIQVIPNAHRAVAGTSRRIVWIGMYRDAINVG